MATYTKFNIFVQDLANGVHNFSTASYKIGLTNTSPNVADTVVDTSVTPNIVRATSLAAEITAGNGYTVGGSAITFTTNSQTAGTYTLAGNQIVWTAAGGTIGPFRYVYMYNNTAATTATRPVVAWWDYGAALTLQDGETFTVKFNNTNPGTIFTLA